MNVFGAHFLPDRLRPRAPRRRSRRRLVAPAAAVLVVAAAALTVSRWQIASVEITGADAVPGSVAASFEDLVGHAVLLLDLDWARRLAATWPAAGEVRVRLELPGTLVVEIAPQAARGSAPVGRGWHAVAADGGLAGPLDGPVSPRLEGFRRAGDRRLAFGVVRRLAEGAGAEVVEIRQVTPLDYQVALRDGSGDLMTVVHVAPEATDSERAWYRMVAEGSPRHDWADLRWPNRLVLREVG
ncbi:MAG TPA: hypothetical protein VLT32_09455 [Candidatus Sulfomarinibacteraceae bacterium]|nr:hypothetical protein [Candidatus Sulfomarinibacteraceae bacterium]